MKRVHQLMLVAAIAVACLAIAVSASGADNSVPVELASVSPEAQQAMARAANTDVRLVDLSARDDVDPGLTLKGCTDYVDADSGDMFMYDEGQNRVRQYFSASALNGQRPANDTSPLPVDKLLGIARDEALSRLSFEIPEDWKSSYDTRVTVHNEDGEISQWVVEFREYFEAVMSENYVRIALDPLTGELLWFSQNRASTDADQSDVVPVVSADAAVDVIASELKVDRYDVQRVALIRWQAPDGSPAVLVWDIILVLPGTGRLVGGGQVDAKTGEVLGTITPRTPVVGY